MKRDRLSDLPDHVLHHIMKFMKPKDAVQTCLLSKRWKDVWKSLTHLNFRETGFWNLKFFEKFVSSFLSNQDSSKSLHSVDLCFQCTNGPELLRRVIRYVVSHSVQELSIQLDLHRGPNYDFIPSIFSCRSLTSLKVCYIHGEHMLALPKSLRLPALKTLHLHYVTFAATDGDCAEPFSMCNMLNTLFIDGFTFNHGTKVLCISNSNLSSLTICNHLYRRPPRRIEISTPNLNSLTIMGTPILQLSSACNLSFLQEVEIDDSTWFGTVSNGYASSVSQTAIFIISWLPLLASVKKMTLWSTTLKIMLCDLSNSGSRIAQPPCFVRLKSLKVIMQSFAKLSDEELRRIVEYLLQNSPLARVDIVNDGY